MNGSRQISAIEYLKVLQLEYLSHKLREAIYVKPEFIKMSREIASKKKVKILEIAKKFQLLCIFDSEEQFAGFCEKNFFQEFGLPKFQYGLNTDKKKAVAYWDMFYLLKPGTEVIYKNKTYKIDGNDPNSQYVQILVNGDFVLLPYTDIKIKGLKTLLRAKLK